MIKKHSTIPIKEITRFTRQLSTLINANIPLVQSFLCIEKTITNPKFILLLKRIRFQLENGHSFAAAIKNYPHLFDKLYCNLIESGEQSGTLDIMLNRIAHNLEKREELKRKIRKASLYPVCVLGVSLIVTFILLTTIVPTFKEIFKNFGAELPLFTRYLLSLSDFLKNHTILFLITLISVLFLPYKLYQKNAKYRLKIDNLLLRLPYLGPFLNKQMIACFARTLAITTSAGIPLTDSLQFVAKSFPNQVYEKTIVQLKEYLAKGEQLQHAIQMIQKIHQNAIFPSIVTQMLTIGEECGELESMFAKIAAIYEEEVNAAIDELSTLFEPFIMILMGIIVGGLIMALYLPIFKMGTIF